MEGGGNINKRVRMVSAILAIVILWMIWQFSAQNAGESSGLSRGVAEWLMTMPGGQNLANVGNLDHILRKIAHFVIYLALGVSLAGIFINQRTRKVIAVALMLGVVFAMVDEWHQSFVPGRGPGWHDVLLDTCGVMVGILLMVALRRIYRQVAGRRRINP